MYSDAFYHTAAKQPVPPHPHPHPHTHTTILSPAFLLLQNNLPLPSYCCRTTFPCLPTAAEQPSPAFLLLQNNLPLPSYCCRTTFPCLPTAAKQPSPAFLLLQNNLPLPSYCCRTTFPYTLLETTSRNDYISSNHNLAYACQQS